MRPGKVIVLLLAVAAAFALAACSGKESDSVKRRLMVGIPAQKMLLEAIAGPDFEVESLFDAGTDPETIEPSMTRLRALGESEAYFKVGGFPVEEALLARVQQGGQKLNIIDTGAEITRLADKAHGSGGDPHIWTSPANLRKMAAPMLAELARLNPDAEQAYAERYAALQKRLEALERQCAARLRPHKGKAVVVWHPSLGYFARDFGLRQIALEPDGKEPTPRQMRDALEEARNAGAAVVATETGHSRERSEAVAGELGTKNIEINLLAEDIIAQINAIADAIAR